MFNKFFKYIFYGNGLFSFLRHKIISNTIIAFSSLYFLTFEIYRTEWSVFTVHAKPSQYMFFALVGLSFFIVVLKGIGEWVEEKNSISKNGFRNDLIILSSKLVKVKLERFKKYSPSIKRNGNIFKNITQPKEQINILLGEFSKILQDKFNLNEDQLCITIMQIDIKGNNITSFFDFKTQQDWTRTKAKKLLEENSTARQCLEIGEPILFANKYKAAKSNEYFISDRDNRYDKGSVYCYPCFVQMPDSKKQYVISVVTYGKQICYHGDKEETEAIKEILNEICRRIDLELTLKSIKDWQG